MKLGDKVPVPELDELRVARIERAIVAEVSSTATKAQVAPARSYRRVAYAMVAVAGVVLAAFVALRSSQVDLLDTPFSPSEATEVATGPGQSSSLRLGDAQVQVGASTRVSVQRFGDGRTVLHLSAGSVHCEVQPRAHRPTFQVVSGDVIVTVVGTAFEVTRSHIVEVKVQRGIVSVETSYDELKLVAGDAWQGSPFADKSLAALVAAHENLNPAGTLVTDNARLENATEKTPVEPKHPDPTKNLKTPKTNGKHDEGDAGVPQKTIKLSEVLLSAKPLPPIYKQSHSDELGTLERVAMNNPKKAVLELQSYAAKTTGDEASFALYTRAYLLFFKLAQYSLVIKTAKQYARRFPKGPESEDMLWLRVRASCAASEFSSCRAAAHSYLQRYPKGIFQGLASRIVTTAKTD